MSSLSIFYGVHSHAREICDQVVDTLGYTILTDEQIIDRAAKESKIPREKIIRAVYGKPSVFNKFTHERARCIAHLKAAMAKALQDDEKICYGFLGHLVPRAVSHMLRVCLIADLQARTRTAINAGCKESEVAGEIAEADEKAAGWTRALFDKEPWDPSLYDIVIPTDKKSIEECSSIICSHITKDIVQPTLRSRSAVQDFALAAEVELALVREGHEIKVNVEDGIALLTIEKNVIMLSRLEEELKSIVSNVPGIDEVKIKIGPNFYRNDIYRRADFQAPSRILLVDDEQEFAQTLSERMLMRDMGTHVVYDGAQALDFVEDDEPEVMVLDLKMPGIDGFEVLRRIKKDHPSIEVIILTGHGSAKDRDKCMELGAFAYLEKPVDIDLLTKTINQAYAKISQA